MHVLVKTNHNIPAELQGFFDNPPILLNESRDAYDQLRASIIETIEPKNTYEWMWVKSLLTYGWEERRLGKMKADLANLTWKEAVRNILESLLPGDLAERRRVARDCAEGFFGPEGRERVMVILRRHKLTEDAIAAQSLTLRLPELEIIDRQLHRACLMRIAIARDIVDHRVAGSWKTPEDVLVTIDGRAGAIPLSPSSDQAALVP
jgi:hypothetical protein